jgi:HD-GYP domain-containing protein (c-di-GMP phosphodiesterase class II)
VHGAHISEQEVLLTALEARDPGTARHTHGVIELSERVAIRMGLSDEGVAEVTQVAALHDIGKLATPDAILHKTGVLDEVERTIMQAHTIVGGELLGHIPSLAHLELPVRATHERWDGTGYPDRLPGPEIPLGARIIFVVDAFDAMTSDRVYRGRLSQEEALAELERCAGTQFDPDCVAALAEELEIAEADELAAAALAS